MKFIKLFTIISAFLVMLPLFVFQAQAFRFVVYSDCRAPKTDWTVAKKSRPYNLFNKDVLEYINSQIVELDPKPSFVLIGGDMVNRAYPNTDVTYTNSNLQYFKDFMTETLDGIKLYVAVGNSDLYGITWWTELDLQTEFAQIFNDMPDNGPQTPVDFRHLVYSFEQGEGKEKSLFVVLDSFGIYSEVGKTTVHCDNDFDPYAFGDEQIDWFTSQVAASSANHKFVFAHGPAFSVIGFPVARNVKKIWDIAMSNQFDTFFCAHEHIFRRWNIDKASYPTASGSLIQNLTGTAGAVPDSALSVQANPDGRIYFGYNFLVVDVEGDNVTERAYAVAQGTNDEYSAQLIDTVIISK